jgi:hypothetical protein
VLHCRQGLQTVVPFCPRLYLWMMRACSMAQL